MEMLLSAFTALSLLLGNEIFFILLVGAMVLFAEKRAEKRKKILLGILVVAIMVVAIKNIFATERPCMDGAEYGCPAFPLMEYSFPSGHAAVAFLVLIAFLDKPSFPLFWAFALFVAFSRLFLGVHTFEDIAGALALAPVSYHITDGLWGRFFA